jgi:protein CpxP
MTFTLKLSAPVLLLALMLPVAASAQMMGPPPGMGQPGMGHPGGGQPGLRQGQERARHHGMEPGLELSEAQQDKAFALKHGQEPLHRELVKAVHKAREAMHSMVKSGEFDEKKAVALSQALGQAVAALEMHQARSHAQFMALLTPEQRKLMSAERAPRPHH